MKKRLPKQLDAGESEPVARTILGECKNRPFRQAQSWLALATVTG